MIGSTRNLSVWAYPAPTDLRSGYDGLSALVTGKLGLDPLSGDCFLFVNRTRTRAKVLVWDGTGLCIYQKRLEQGRFAALWKRERRVYTPHRRPNVPGVSLSKAPDVSDDAQGTLLFWTPDLSRTLTTRASRWTASYTRSMTRDPRPEFLGHQG